jgi:hypothetical protein
MEAGMRARLITSPLIGLAIAIALIVGSHAATKPAFAPHTITKVAS